MQQQQQQPPPESASVAVPLPYTSIRHFVSDQTTAVPLLLSNHTLLSSNIRGMVQGAQEDVLLTDSEIVRQFKEAVANQAVTFAVPLDPPPQQLQQQPPHMPSLPADGVARAGGGPMSLDSFDAMSLGAARAHSVSSSMTCETQDRSDGANDVEQQRRSGHGASVMDSSTMDAPREDDGDHDDDNDENNDDSDAMDHKPSST